ncbi:MAG TPA: MEDS domain-containing protein [Terriglobales bacterium]|nr:MEDS domain-containing protein [Terriglobales bacterium]
MATSAPYAETLRRPQPCDHLIQLYTDEGFLGRAVGAFLGAGLAGGEAAVIIATPPHAALFRERLAADGLDVAAAEARGQLVVRDAQASLGAFMVDGMPDRDRFRALVTPVLAYITASGFGRTRLYGEMVDLLWNHSLPATVALEQLWNEVLAETRVSLLCAYGIDTFDRQIQRGVLHQITACHTELIPVEDYGRLERAVDLAYADVFGSAGEATLLREHMVARYKAATKMPAPQAALLALRDVAPLVADSLVDRARFHFQS